MRLGHGGLDFSTAVDCQCLSRLLPGQLLAAEVTGKLLHFVVLERQRSTYLSIDTYVVLPLLLGQHPPILFLNLRSSLILIVLEVLIDAKASIQSELQILSCNGLLAALRLHGLE